MPSIRPRENEPLEIACRRFKRLCEKEGTLSKIRSLEFYEKPAEKRKRLKNIATKRNRRRLLRDRLPLLLRQRQRKVLKRKPRVMH